MKHDLYDENFEPATAFEAEGARIGLATCKRCGPGRLPVNRRSSGALPI